MNFMFYNLFFFCLLFLSYILILSADSWFSIWVYLEINTMVFILLIMLNNFFIYDMMMKYFLINSFSSLVYMVFCNLYIFYNSVIFMIVMNLMMLIKLGFIPFHFWFIDMMENLNWFILFFFSTWQKIVPFYILSYMYMNYYLIYLILFSSFMSVIYAMNEFNLKKILGYSSINHMGWMYLSIMYSETLFLIYFFIYMILNLVLVMFFHMFSLINIFMMMMFLNKNMFNYLMLFIMFSLGGLPPFLGFAMKWYFLNSSVIFNDYLYMLVLIFFSLIFLYYYMRLMFSNMMFNSMNLKMLFNFNIYNIKFNKSLFLLILIGSMFMMSIFLNYMFL